MAPVLEVGELTGGYGDALVMDGISLRVSERELVTVIGPNGAGKSTLLKAIVGLVPVRSGSIAFSGSSIVRMPPERIIGLGIRYVPQVDNVFPSLTVRENLELMVARRIARQERDRRLEVALGHFERLRERIRVRAGLLSGGERQMLALARALMTDPALILLDEPTAAVAPVVVGVILERIRAIRDAGIPILLVEQNARLALSMSDRGYILESGRNALDGPAADLLENPMVTRLYLGAHAASREAT